MLEDTVQTPAVENPPPEELPAELPSPELPEGVTLPEPPVEVEASGSGDLEDMLQPTTPTEADVSVEETVSEDGLITGDVTINADANLEAETEEDEVAAVGEEPTTATLDEEHLNEVEIPEELEISTIASKTTEEEGLPALVSPPEAVDVANEASEPASETGLLPVDDNSAEGNEDADVIVKEVKEETVPEAPAVEEEASEAPQISTEDLTEDEVLLVNEDEPEPPVADILSPAPPTALSPERESPFTRISDVNPDNEGQPHVVIPSLVEVTHIDVNVKYHLHYFSKIEESYLCKVMILQLMCIFLFHF